MKTNQGFTLIELMIVVAVVAILSMIAIPTYSSYIQKSRRTDAYNSLYAIQSAQETYRGSNTTYGTLAQAYNNNSTSHDGYYTLAITANSATAFTATATAVSGTSQATDSEQGTNCNTLTLAISGAIVTKSPSVCW